MLTVIVGFDWSGKSSTLSPLGSLYSVMPSTSVTLVGVVPTFTPGSCFGGGPRLAAAALFTPGGGAFGSAAGDTFGGAAGAETGGAGCCVPGGAVGAADFLASGEGCSAGVGAGDGCLGGAGCWA